jgi:hypothetical protein
MSRRLIDQARDLNDRLADHQARGAALLGQPDSPTRTAWFDEARELLLERRDLDRRMDRADTRRERAARRPATTDAQEGTA